MESLGGALETEPVESFHARAGDIVRTVRRRSGGSTASVLLTAESVADGPVSPELSELAWLRSVEPPAVVSGSERTIRCVDLFSGCGGISLGIAEACRSLGARFEVALAADTDDAALGVFAKNFLGSVTEQQDVTDLVNGVVGARLTREERDVRRATGTVDLLVGGPPCQGHSDFNNRTRRMDPKNELYFTMVRAAEVFEPEHVIIENVPGAARDRGMVVQRTVQALSDLGYEVDSGVVDVGNLGVPQRRKRLVVLASRRVSPAVADIAMNHTRPTRGVGWAIQDLEERFPDALIDQSCASAPATKRRIDYLFDNDVHDLPDSERPPCHSGKNHSYKSIYGRLHWERPAQTITTGFYSMCMGRYVHPTQRRTLTAHEAARIQWFPDFFDFSGVTKRSELARMIGNAVPSRLAYVSALELMR